MRVWDKPIVFRKLILACRNMPNHQFSTRHTISSGAHGFYFHKGVVIRYLFFRFKGFFQNYFSLAFEQYNMWIDCTFKCGPLKGTTPKAGYLELVVALPAKYSHAFLGAIKITLHTEEWKWWRNLLKSLKYGLKKGFLAWHGYNLFLFSLQHACALLLLW